MTMHDPTKPYTVYIRTDEHGRVTGINSDAFLEDTEGWQPIDRGFGDRFHHAQGNYLLKPLMSQTGSPNWKFVNGHLLQRTDEEKAADEQPEAPVPFEPDADDIARLSMRMEEFDQSLDMLLMGVTDDAQI
jgi:hypothetical protein